MISNFFKALGGVLSLIICGLVLVVAMYISYILAIGLFVIVLIFATFSTLEVFRKH